MEKDRNTDGRFKSDTADAEILAAVRAHEPAATSEVAAEVDMTRQGADRRLRRLRDGGRVNSKKIGASLVWFAPQQDATPDAVDDAEVRGSVDTSLADDHTDESNSHQGDGAGDVVEEMLRDLDLPGSGEKLTARIEAIGTMYAYLRDHAGDTVEKDDLLALVDPDAVGYKDESSFWSNCVKANAAQGRQTNALVALPGVEDWGDGKYRFTGDDGEGFDQ